jgi:putative ABC transport system ATP-binding protein
MTDNQNYLLQTRQLSISFADRKVISFPDLNLKKADKILILGNSGSGKTTLLHLLAGLRKPTSGKVLYQDFELTTASETAKDQFRGQNIGIVFQQAHLISALTVMQNLEAAAYFAHKKADKAYFDSLLKTLNIYDKKDKLTTRLSVGEQQRVAIARALANRPALLFADEPTAALDEENCYSVIDLLQTLTAQQATTLLIVTHDLRLKTVFQNQIML